MIAFFAILYQIVQSEIFYFLTILSAFLVKCYLLKILVPKGLQSSTNKISWVLLLGVLFGSLAGDLSWLLKMTRYLFLPIIPYGLCVFSIRIAWAGLIIQYQSLALFIESLTKKKYRLDLSHKIVLSVSSLFVIYYVVLAFFENELTNEITRNRVFLDTSLHGLPLEVKMMRYVSMYLLPLVIFPSLFLAFKNIKNEKLPTILKKQLTVLIKYLLCPFLIAEFIIAVQVNVQHIRIFETGLLSISTLLISYSIYYCIQKLLVLRFLNFDNQLMAKQRTNFINNFKDILEQLSTVSTLPELAQITQTLFKETFNVSPKKIFVFFRDQTKQRPANDSDRAVQLELVVEEFMKNHSAEVCEFIRQSKILIYDEIAFTNFYQDDGTSQAVISFLHAINADIFIPIFQKHKIIAYIIIEAQARAEKLYTSADRDEMIILSNYIGTIINLLKNRNLEMLIVQEKEIKDQLYVNHQLIGQYKESIETCIQQKKIKDIGILFYKSGHFIIGNKAAQELIKINLNTAKGHPITRAISDIAEQVETFKIPQTTLINFDNLKIVVSAMLNLEKNNVIIAIYYPEITDIIKPQVNLIKNPNEWDYLLYLETTSSGSLVNQLMPGHSQTILNAKIDLLRLGLSKAPVLLEASDDDRAELVSLFHQMSVRTSLHTISLQEPVKNTDLVTKIFGRNPLLENGSAEKPLLDKLDMQGTLFIENIHYADMHTQEHLADYFRTGHYKLFKSDHKKQSNVRFLCSSNQNLALLVQEGQFSASLYNQLKTNSFFMPSLVTLSDHELLNIIDEIMNMFIGTNNFQNLLELNEKEKQKILLARPSSFTELKKKIKNLIMLQSKKQNIEEQVTFTPAQSFSDPDLIKAAQLGKSALKDQRTLHLLWNKFKNQNKIATFLGVNRSSVNRRMKEFNLK